MGMPPILQMGVHEPATPQLPLLHVAFGAPVKPAKQGVVQAAPLVAGRAQANADAFATIGGWVEHPAGEGIFEAADRCHQTAANCMSKLKSCLSA